MKRKRDKKINILKRAYDFKIKFNGVMQEFNDVEKNLCKINLSFNREAVVDGCKAVSDYGDDRISLKVDGGLLVIDGSNLHLHSFEAGCAIVRGSFSNVSFNF